MFAFIIAGVCLWCNRSNWRASKASAEIEERARLEELEGRFRLSETRELAIWAAGSVVLSLLWSLVLVWAMGFENARLEGALQVVTVSPTVGWCVGLTVGVCSAYNLWLLPVLDWRNRAERQDWELYKRVKVVERRESAGLNFQRLITNLGFVAALALWSLTFTSKTVVYPDQLAIGHWSFTNHSFTWDDVVRIESHESFSYGGGVQKTPHFRVTFDDGRVWSTSDLANNFFDVYQVGEEGLRGVGQDELVREVSSRSGIEITTGKDPAPRWGDLRAR